jgi:hypothetical protein
MKVEINMRGIRNLSILVLFILIVILLSYNIQALPQQEIITNYRWYNSFYIDTTFNQTQSNSSVCYGDSLFIVSWIQEIENNHTHIYVKRIISDSITLDSLPIDVTRRDSIMYYKIDNAYLDGYIFTIYSNLSPHSYYSGDNDIDASIIDIYNDSIIKMFIDYSFYNYWEFPPYFEYELREVRYPVVASDNEKFLIMYDYYYEESLTGSTWSYGPVIIGKFYNSNGECLNEFHIPCSWRSNPKSLIFDGENYILLLRYNYGALYITKIDTSGNITKQDSISLYSSDTKFEVGTNAVASGNSKYLVVWSDYTGGSHCIIGRLYSEDFSIIDSSIFISQDQYVKTYPSIVFDGNNFIVTWQEYKWDSYNIKGAVVSPFGCVIDSFVIDNNEGDQVDTKLAYGNGHTLLTYTGWSTHFGTDKIMGKFNDQTAVGIVKKNEKERSLIKCFIKYCNPNKIILHYSIEQSYYIKLKLFDITGRNIKNLDIGDKKGGKHSITLDCSSLTRGVYFYNLEYGNNKYSGKVNIMR